MELRKLKKHLSPVASVEIGVIDDKMAFCITFARIFAADTPNYDLGDGTIGATRSNWTYHAVFAIAQTAKTFNLICKFECSGKRDAVIETDEDKPKTLLVAEWEWDYKDIFGEGKELEKLKGSCRRSKTAEAFLLVYCPTTEFADYLLKIVTYWQRAFPRSQTPPALFINTIIYSQRSRHREFETLNTTMIHGSTVQVLNHIEL